MQASARHEPRCAIATAVALLLILGTDVCDAQQPLETETARLPARHELVVNAAYEFQSSTQGTEHAVPFALEYGLSDRWNLLVEPVFFTAILPRPGARALGVGDLEVTSQFLVVAEGHTLPALAIAAEEKFPTAANRAIGTGRADFTPYLIASKRLGNFEAHVNVGYSFMGRPVGLQVQNTLNLAAAVERHFPHGLDAMAEVLSTSASLSGGEGLVNPNAPELAGAEQVVMVGVRQHYRRNTWWSLAVTYDNTNAVLIRPGLSILLR
jgi:hypothetical protein